MHMIAYAYIHIISFTVAGFLGGRWLRPSLASPAFARASLLSSMSQGNWENWAGSQEASEFDQIKILGCLGDHLVCLDS